ncbi:MAG: hypothetical protein KDB22_26220, partial [Planctomycetales bacterium]|nr:hypothetical protein [Planctomycetales bacterium]
ATRVTKVAPRRNPEIRDSCVLRWHVYPRPVGVCSRTLAQAGQAGMLRTQRCDLLPFGRWELQYVPPTGRDVESPT